RRRDPARAPDGMESGRIRDDSVGRVDCADQISRATVDLPAHDLDVVDDGELVVVWRRGEAHDVAGLQLDVPNHATCRRMAVRLPRRPHSGGYPCVDLPAGYRQRKFRRPVVLVEILYDDVVRAG